MSGLAAAVSLDGGTLAPDAVRRLDEALRYRGPRGIGRWTSSAAIFLQYRGAATSPDAAPMASADGTCVLAFDGRLTGASGSAASEPADDVAVVHAALEGAEDPPVERLEGEVALVMWRARARRLLLARDRLGLRPLHWTRVGNTVLVASDVAALVAARGGTPPPDETAVAELLGGEPPADTRTLFKGISRVPPGSVVSIDAAGTSVRRYWEPTPRPVRPTASDEEFAAACRSLVDRAVGASIEAPGPVAVFFSGGVDSSIVLTRATALARERGIGDPVPIALDFDEPESDERRYRDAVAAALGVRVRSVRPDPPSAEALAAMAARRGGLPDLPADFGGRALRRVATAEGVSVALTGAGPDAVFSGSSLRYADLVARGRVVSAVAAFRRDRRVEDSGASPGALLSAGVWPLLPASLRSRVRRTARSAARVDARRAWLRLPRPERPVVPDPPAGVSHASWEIAWSLRSGWTAYFIEASEQIAAETAVPERYPLLDPALIEFALSIPEEQRYRDGVIKHVLRRAVPELAPIVRERRTKADFSHVVVAALRALGGRRFFASLAIAEAGWVDAEALARRYDRLDRWPAVAEAAGDDVPMLWMVAATEVWFRAAYGNPGVKAV